MESKEELKHLEDLSDQLPVFFNHLTEIVFSDSNVMKITAANSERHQTSLYEVKPFYKPLCKIAE